MQQLVDQLNPNHEISRSLQNSNTRIQLFNEYDQPNVLSLWQDLLHEPRALPFRDEEFSRPEESKSLLDRRAEYYPGIPILLVDTNINRGEGLPAVQKKVKVHDTMDEFHHAPLMSNIARKRDDDELAQPFDECEEGVLGVEKNEANNIIDKVHGPARKWKVVRKRKNSADYDGDDELNQPDIKRAKPSRKPRCNPF
ncbi:hypothetical protein FMUND_15672 [Fusarium mundagurra]|uniref:Uncharacterized protein n=1 Tax=Fusarium mundagurra TaxID=1567541 RepID=A0A8H5XMW1_9HYPO|nr:hypothetical protein FMUND_15672 [Fusarium mundagurra]